MIYRNTPENAEVCANTGLPFDDSLQLVARLREALAMPETQRAKLRAAATKRIAERYDWEVVTTQYEQLLANLKK